MNTASEKVATIEAALAHARRLLEKKPELAALQAREILNVYPGHPQARLILGAAHRHAGDAPAALEMLEPLAVEQPNAAPVHLELGVARGEAGRATLAIAALRRARGGAARLPRRLAPARRSCSTQRAIRRAPIGAGAVPQGRE